MRYFPPGDRSSVRVMREIETPQGIARVHEQDAHGGWARLVLGHGAGGSVSAPDLQIAARTALEEGVSVALVEQPYRVAGKKSTPRTSVLDEAWLAVTATLAGPLIFGGRSSGARVACRTAEPGGAIGVLALAFPLTTPKGASRQEELDAVTVPLLIVQGASDRFGMPANAVQVKGDHGLKADAPRIAEVIREWLRSLKS
jgi:predicted alpha/beta-hydrolase family hydrolase